jgi:thermostable 8-oxoguanine DNA glycosylase
VLDVHILKFLRDNGYPNAPKQTPSEKAYLKWEKVFLAVCKEMFPHKSIAEIDLDIWTKYSGRNDDAYLKVEANA